MLVLLVEAAGSAARCLWADPAVPCFTATVLALYTWRHMAYQGLGHTRPAGLLWWVASSSCLHPSFVLGKSYLQCSQMAMPPGFFTRSITVSSKSWVHASLWKRPEACMVDVCKSDLSSLSSSFYIPGIGLMCSYQVELSLLLSLVQGWCRRWGSGATEWWCLLWVLKPGGWSRALHATTVGRYPHLLLHLVHWSIYTLQVSTGWLKTVYLVTCQWSVTLIYGTTYNR